MKNAGELLQQLVKILEDNPETKIRYSAEIQRFNDNKQTNDNDKFRLGVIGVTSSGKSTMINSLLGESLLPAVAKPSSSQLVTCFKGNNRCATVFFENSTQKVFSKKELTPAIISRYGDENSNSRNKEHVKQIEIRTPKFPFDENLVLIDSPGLDAFGFEGHEQLTMHSLLPTIDFALFITTCKTNSDEKMRTVLNVIAEYDKPVIIIQNMIDSIRESPDGRKSVDDVALDHKRRLERVVKESKIRDKSKVFIIQISAKWALEAREEQAKGLDFKSKLKKSNYEYLINSISSVFSLVKPNVEINRVRLLKKDIDKIIEDAEKDSQCESLDSISFEFAETKTELSRKYESCESQISNEINKLIGKQNEVRGCRLNQGDLNNIVQFASDIENNVIAKMKSYYQEIGKYCEMLNVDVRNYTMGFQTSNLGSLNVQQETYTERTRVFDRYEYVPKTGALNKVKIFFGKIFGQDDWGTEEVARYKYVTETHTRTDYEGTCERAINYLSKAISSYRRTLSNWGRTIVNINNALFLVVDKKKIEFENRKKLALKAEVYQKLAKKLKELSSSIKLDTSRSEVVHTDNEIGVHNNYSDVNVPTEVYCLTRLAQVYEVKMHQAVMEAFSDLSKKNIIVGWDKISEAGLLKRNYGLSVDYNSIKDGINCYTNVQVIHNPTPELIKRAKDSRPSNLFVLVNATQYGAAKKQIYTCNLNTLLNGSDMAFFVIQDFSEIINAQAIRETLKNMINLGKEIDYKMDYKILISHTNPLYNLAAAQVQMTPCKIQSDEVSLINEFQTKFPFLINGNTKVSNILQTIVNVLSSK